MWQKYRQNKQRTIKEGRSKRTKLILMYVCTRTRRRLIRWIHSNSTLVVFIQFQTPNHHFMKAESRWFRNEPLGKNTIAKLMENISSKAELSERYTNHCIRASTIAALYQRGVDAKQICAITKHKDERSLSHYISQTTSEQKTAMLQVFARSVLWTSTHTNLSRLTFVNTSWRWKYQQDWRSHFSFANTAESFSI